jgi:hypothetical protein
MGHDPLDLSSFTDDHVAAQDRPLTPPGVVERAGGGMSVAAFILAAMWVAAAYTIAFAVLGADRIGALTSVEMAALTFAAFLPAALLVFAGAISREGVRAQAQARRLADAADRMMNPSPVAEAAARRLGISVRGEIAALDRSLAETLSKLQAVEAVIARQTQAVDQAAVTAQQGAGHLVGGLEKERAALARISEDLSAQAARVTESIGRQTASLAASAREADAQLRAADQVLESRQQAFGASAVLIGDRTGLLTQAAAQTAQSSQRLETALAGALDTLAKATSLTDAARQSTDSAMQAANATASAVRDTTARAIEDARKAAEMIRAEAQAVEREAAAALDRLREAGDAARLAAEGARAASGAAPPRQPAPPTVSPSAAPSRPFFFAANGAKDRDARREADRRAFERMEADRLGQVARAPDAAPGSSEDGWGSTSARTAQRPQARVSLDETVAAERSNRERWTWRDMVGAIEAEAAEAAATPPPAPVKAPQPVGVQVAFNDYEAVRPAPAARRSAPAQAIQQPSAAPRVQHASGASLAAAFAPRPALGEQPVARRGDVIADAGLNLSEVFSYAALDRIAARARNGTAARRRAVRDAAPAAVERLSVLLERNPQARAQASRFLEAEGARLADLLGRGRASMSADATRAFLLLDAASS